MISHFGRTARRPHLALFVMMSAITAAAGCERAVDAVVAAFRPATVTPDEYAIDAIEEEIEAINLRDVVDLSPLDAHQRVFDIDSIALREPAENFEMPENADDRLRVTLSRMLDEPSLNVIVRIPMAKLPSDLSYSLAPDGSRLYLIDSDNMITVSELTTKKVLFRGPSPLEKSYAITPDGEGDVLYLLGEGKLVRYDWRAKNELARIEVPGYVNDWERAAEAGTIVAMNANREVFVIDADLSRIRKLEGQTASNRSVSIRPDGQYAIFSVGDGLARWHFDREIDQLERLPCGAFTATVAKCCSENDADRWFDSTGMHQYSGQVNYQVTDDDMIYPIFMGIATAAAASYPSGDSSDAIVAGWVTDDEGQPEMAIARIGFHHVGVLSNPPVKIDCTYIHHMAASRDGSRAAVMTDRELLVIDVPKFTDGSGELTAYNLGKLVYRDRLELLEEVAAKMRQRDWPRQHVSGEMMYTMIIQCVGSEWMWAEQNQDDPQGKEAFERFERWRQAGSELAVCCSAARHFQVGTNARGSGWASEVSAEGFETLEQRIELALRELDEVLKSDRPPAYALDQYLYSLKYSRDGTLDDAMRYVARCMQLYPEYVQVHRPVIVWLMPRWGGFPTAGHQYLEAVSLHYPATLRDQVYALAACHSLKFFGPALMSREEAGFASKRILDGALPLLRSNSLGRDECEATISVAKVVGWNSLYEPFTDHHLGHYATPSWGSYRFGSRNALVERKRHLLGPAVTALRAIGAADRPKHVPQEAQAQE